MDVRSNTLSQAVQPSCWLFLYILGNLIEEAFPKVVVVYVNVFLMVGNDGMVGKVNGGGIVAHQGNRYHDIKFLNPNEIPAGLSSSYR